MAAGLAAFRPQVNHPIRLGNQIQIVLDHDDRMPGIHQPLQHLDEPANIRDVQANRRLFENEQIAAGHALELVRFPQAGEQMRDQLHALRLAAAQGRAGLAEPQIAEARVAQGRQRPFDALHRAKKVDRLLHGHLQRLRDILAAVFDVECFAVEPAAAANFAAHKGRREKVHFEFDRAGALAFGAAALRAVEGKPARRITAQPRFRHLRVELPHHIEETDISRREWIAACGLWAIDPLRKPPGSSRNRTAPAHWVR